MHFPTAISLLLSMALITSRFSCISTEFADDTTPRKIQLEDLEIEQEERQQLQQQQLPLRTTPRQPQLPPPSSYYNQQSVYIRPTKPTYARLIISRPHAVHAPSARPSAAKHETEADAAQSYRYDVNAAAYSGLSLQAENEIEEQEQETPSQLQSLQSLQQLSSGYAPRPKMMALELQPPAGDQVEPHDISDASQQQQQQQQYAEQQQQEQQHARLSAAGYLSSRPVAHGYNNNGPAPPLVSYAPNEAAPTAFVSAFFDAPAGVQYVSSNHLSEAAPFNPRRPIIVYEQQQPLQPASPAHFRSKQYSYAPAPPEPGQLPHHAANVPFPPSFVSITSTAAPTSEGSFHRRPFKPSPLDPVPDFFVNRRAKSLLDSYIPSWLVQQMLQWRPQPQPQFNTLAYISATPYMRNFKRESAALQQTRTQPPSKPSKQQLKTDKQQAEKKVVTA